MLEYTVEAPIAWARLNRPEKLNAMPRSFWSELTEVLDRAYADPEVRVLVFHGAGRCFSVGGDIESFTEFSGSADRRRFAHEALTALRAVELMRKPTIAAMHGHAVGGGCELSMVCDIVVADETLEIGIPESRVGLIPGLAAFRGLSHMSLHWLKYMIFTGETLDARTAREVGLVNTVTAAGGHVAEAERVARLIASRSPLALASGKAILGRDADEGREHAAEMVAFLQGSEDAAEGISAFLEKREPSFDVD